MISLQKFTFSNSKAVPREIDKADYLYIYIYFPTTQKKQKQKLLLGMCNEIFIYKSWGIKDIQIW